MGTRKHYARYALRTGDRNRAFTGMLDEIAIYNRALTEDEIQDVMENGHSDSVKPVNAGAKLAACWGSIKARN